MIAFNKSHNSRLSYDDLLVPIVHDVLHFCARNYNTFFRTAGREIIISIRKTTCYASQILWEFLEFKFYKKIYGSKKIYILKIFEI